MGLSLLRLLVLSALVLAGLPARAWAESDSDSAPTLVLTDTQREVFLGGGAGVLADPAASLDLEAARRGRYEPATENNPRLSVRWRAAWLKLRIDNRTSQATWQFWQPHPMPDRLDVYRISQSGEVHHQALAARDFPTSFPQRGIATRLHLPPGETSTVYLRYEGRLQAVTATLAAPDTFAHSYGSGQLAHGLWYGLMLALFGYNLFLYLSLRDNSYGYYLLHIAIVMFFYFARNAHLGEVDATRGLALALASKWNLTTVCVHGLSTVAITGFARRLFDTQRTAPRTNRALWIVAATPLIGIVTVLLTDGRLGDSLAALSQLAALIAVLATGVVMWRRGNPLARLYLLAWGAFISTATLYIFRYLGVLPYNAWTEFMPQVGAALEAVLLSLTLAYRVRLLERGEARARQDAALARAERDATIARARSEGFTRILEATDQERRRIARDLHDGLGQLLLRAKTAVASNEAKAPELLQQSIDEARAISHGLHPDRLDRVGLTAALSALVEDLPEREGLFVDADILDVDGVLSRDEEMHVYRIAQEAVKNAYVHGNGRSIFVGIELVPADASERAERLELVVENDGESIDASTGQGLGMTSMRERAAALSAELVVEPLPEGGTRVALGIPLTAGASRRPPASCTPADAPASRTGRPDRSP